MWGGSAASSARGGGRWFCVSLGLVFGLGFALSVVAEAASSRVQLLVVEAPGCTQCHKFMREVGRLYPKTAEGRFAPMRRVRRKHKALRGLNPIPYTPTFIVVRSGKEIGRVTGYPGKAYFFPELRSILSTIGFY